MSFVKELRSIAKAVPGFIRVVRLLRLLGTRISLSLHRRAYPKLLETLRDSSEFRENSIALMTVFILRENILFLEEWIDHHLRMGVDHFFLYDNSKVDKPDEFEYERQVQPGKVNKHGRNYHELVTDDEAQRILLEILDSHPGRITIVPWNRKDAAGFVRYFQREALQDFVSNAHGKWDYCLFTDMDEFLVSRRALRLPDLIDRMNREKITRYYFKSRLFSSRFNYVGKPVLSISMCLPHDREDAGYKSIFRISAVLRSDIHCTTTLLRNEMCPNDDMIMYHYCHNSEATLVENRDALIPAETLKREKA